ncbi:MAG: hypothetical protein WDN04_05695 [Rhodospirillales bacterium]
MDRSAERYVWAVLFCTLGYGAVGFVDDYLKLSRRNTKGVSARGKLVVQVVIGPDFRDLDHVSDQGSARQRTRSSRLQGAC